MNPVSIEDHKSRLSKKSGEEINHLDPVGDNAILRQIALYNSVRLEHISEGILGSYNVKTYDV